MSNSIFPNNVPVTAHANYVVPPTPPVTAEPTYDPISPVAPAVQPGSYKNDHTVVPNTGVANYISNPQPPIFSTPNRVPVRGPIGVQPSKTTPTVDLPWNYGNGS